MVRATTASAHREDDPDSSQAQGDSKFNKRRCVQSACIPCRKRKSKCDGGTPKCATCTAVYKTDCHYDAEGESRRSKPGSSATVSNLGTKRDASLVTASDSTNASSAEFILDSIRKLPDDHVHELIRHIRKDPKSDVVSIAESWRQSVTLPPSTPVEVRSLEADLSMLLGKPSLTFTGESRHFGHSASLGLVPEEENFAGGQMHRKGAVLERQGTTWTSVTSDLGFVENLLNIYFAWSHPFYVLFSRECFYQDFRTGRDKYCSSLLINAICAYACHLTNDPAGRTDASDFRTAGDHFFAEARRLLFEDETPTLTTTQALCIMSMREPSAGRDSSGFSFIGRCIRMCVEMGLHLNNGASLALGLTPSEMEVRRITFWGCFTVDTFWSISIGRISQLPRAAITLDKPIIEESGSLSEACPVTTCMFLREFASLSELVNDNNYMFFAPKERLTSTRLLDCYSKYQAWYKKLPSALGVEGKHEPKPHLLVLHMLYYTIIVHLFRPMLKVDLLHSDIHPRNICIDAANNASRLLRIYRSLYDFRTAHLAIPYILLSVCIVHLLYSKDDNISRQNLVEGLQGLEDIHECHYFGARSFRIIHSLAQTWNLPWPEELRNSKLIRRNNFGNPKGNLSPPTDPALVAPNIVAISMGSNMTYPLAAHSHQRQSPSMFGQGRLQLATHTVTSRPSSIVPGQHYHSPIIPHTPTQAAFDNAVAPTYQYPQSISSVHANASSTSTSPAPDATENMFWNPIPGMPGPILPRNNYQQMSPMGLGSVLQPTEISDRLGRDGFKINEDWRSGHGGGYHTSTAGYGIQHEQAATGYVHRSGDNYTPSAGVAYQQTTHEGHHGDTNEHYDPAWWSHANGNPNNMNG